MAPLTAALVLAATPLAAQSPDAARRPQPSGLASTQVTLAYPAGQAPAGARNAVIRIEYGQPHLRGRSLHTGNLVPYDSAWRTGANGLTTLTTDVNLRLGTVDLPKGTYVLFSLPRASGWKLIVQKSVGQSATAYDPANDVARVDLRLTKLTSPIESFTMWLIPSTAPDAAKGELRFAWGTEQLSVDWSVR